ncbi:hypothetical protein Ciccas_010181 [Cichlidogyrus casuarinus]|uniref:Uncharacterized protein n=1 Tax=Cichlidogyrus casuarinus TaxID=1844966 RepID=A0ABD2PUY2_9PLAT
MTELQKSVLIKSPGKLSKARWLTKANRTLKLYMSTPNPSPQLKQLASFITRNFRTYLKKLWMQSAETLIGLTQKAYLLTDEDPDVRIAAAHEIVDLRKKQEEGVRVYIGGPKSILNVNWNCTHYKDLCSSSVSSSPPPALYFMPDNEILEKAITV